jgi:DNA polymerase III subunit delta
MASSLTALQLDSALKQHPPAPLYLILGEEDLLRDHAVAALKTAVLGDQGDFNFDQFHGDDAHGADILNCASEMPVFAERRLVVVKSAEKLSARESDALLPYLKDPVATTTLVFVSQKLDGRLKFSQALTRAAVTIDCSPLRDAQLTPWIGGEADRLGIRLEDQAVQLLKEVSGGSLYAIRRELEKLASYVAAGHVATAADVQVLRGMEPGASVFDLTLAVAEADRGRALSILARNLDAGEAPLRILGSLAWQYRRLWKVKELLRVGGREGEAARTLRMDPMKVRAFLGRFTEAHLQRALHHFLEADAQLKGGSQSHPRIVMERLLLRLCDFVKQPASPPPPKPPVATGGRSQSRVLSNVRTIRSAGRTGR